MTDYAAVLTATYPDALWSMVNDDYATLVWDPSNTAKKPTKAKLDAAWPQIQYQRDKAAVEAARRARYQAETDGLYFEAMREDTPNLATWRAAVDQIKSDLPYPEEPS